MMNSTSELRTHLETILEHRIPRALTPPQRALPEMIPTTIAAIDALTAGVPLGCLTEICGPASSGRTSVLMTLLAECTRRDEISALIDASDAFDPQSAAAAGVDLTRLLWIRCGSPSQQKHGSTQKDKADKRTFNSMGVASSDPSKDYSQIEQALKITDLLLQAGGFGLVILDLADISIQAARRIPLTTWFRFHRAVENTSTAFVVVEQQPSAKSCASLVLDFAAQQAAWSEAAEVKEAIVGTHFGGISNNDVAFRVTAQGIAIPFDKPMTSSFEMPQRWIAPRPRLLNATHAHFQITRSRGMKSSKKLPVRAEFAIPNADASEHPNAVGALPVQ
jgi:recombination protein RecA